MGALALAQPAQAEIIYTPANILIEQRNGAGGYILNLNPDGIGEFFFHATWQRSYRGSGGFSRLFVIPGQGNAVVGYHESAQVILSGKSIGSTRKFDGGVMAWMQTYFGSDLGNGGRWKDAVNQYLGLKFQIHGQTHYGWARFTIDNYEPPIRATLTGYAYETEANQPIIAGQTSGTDASSVAPAGIYGTRRGLPTPMLGVLALGAPALPLGDEKKR